MSQPVRNFLVKIAHVLKEEIEPQRVSLTPALKSQEEAVAKGIATHLFSEMEVPNGIETVEGYVEDELRPSLVQKATGKVAKELSACVRYVPKTEALPGPGSEIRCGHATRCHARPSLFGFDLLEVDVSGRGGCLGIQLYHRLYGSRSDRNTLDRPAVKENHLRELGQSRAEAPSVFVQSSIRTPSPGTTPTSRARSTRSRAAWIAAGTASPLTRAEWTAACSALVI